MKDGSLLLATYLEEMDMYGSETYDIPKTIADSAHIDQEKYQRMYEASINDPETFWAEQAQKFLSWNRPWDTVMDYDYSQGYIRFFEGGGLNISHNCLDRHLEKRGEKIAIIWQGDDPNVSRKITYRELHEDVCKFANVLKKLGVNKGDRVCIYMQMIPQAAVAMLACTRIGAIHVVVFGGFSSEALRERISDTKCKVVVTCDEGYRGGRKIPQKTKVDEAIDKINCVEKVIVVRRTNANVAWNEGTDLWYHELVAAASSDCPIRVMDAEDPLFILYTSGSTGRPKGLVHTTGGYLLGVAMTYRYVFDYQEGDIYWCTADVGWVTGHSYVVYGPLCNGATTLMFEGTPYYPEADRFWKVIDKYKVNIFYTAPTAIRSLMRHGEQLVRKTDRKSLRILGTVGETINPEAWQWYYHVVGDGRCPIVDTWWQTETGSILIAPLPGATKLKPSSVAKPFFGVQPSIVDLNGKEVECGKQGILVIDRPWPSQARTLWGNHQRFIDTYFTPFPGKYLSGDGALRSKDGYIWITGRIDDVIKVSGHRLGAAEVESALSSHEKVAESAVVGFSHKIKGQGIYAYITLKIGFQPSEELRNELDLSVRRKIGAIASPDVIHWTPDMPKTRSGKIMRRILRKIAENEIDDLGDTSTLADPSIVDDLVRNRHIL